MAEGIPVTRIEIPASRIAAIREAVRTTTHLGAGAEASRLARAEDAPAFFTFLSDPAVHAPMTTARDESSAIATSRSGRIGRRANWAARCTRRSIVRAAARVAQRRASPGCLKRSTST